MADDDPLNPELLPVPRRVRILDEQGRVIGEDWNAPAKGAPTKGAPTTASVITNLNDILTAERQDPHVRVAAARVLIGVLTEQELAEAAQRRAEATAAADRQSALESNVSDAEALSEYQRLVR